MIFNKKADKQFWIIATIILVLVVIVIVSILFITNWSTLSNFLGLTAESATHEVPKLSYIG